MPVVRSVLAAHARGEPLRRDNVRRAIEPQYAGCLQQILQAADLQLRDVSDQGNTETSRYDRTYLG